jgi:UDP-3-O-[3-hydroxymyristoyl] glucosamine N-acyltransferase
MYQLKKFEFHVSDISSLLNVDFSGNDIIVNKICRLGDETDQSLILCNSKQDKDLEKVTSECLVFCSKTAVTDKKNLSYIINDKPEILFFKFINEFLVHETEYWCDKIISVNSIKYPDVIFGYNVKVGKNVIIAPGTKIGNNTVICSNVVIRTNVEIGDGCIIKDNSVIGSEGFGFIQTEEGLMHIPQIGSIRIGNDVVIGSSCTIEKPSMGHTTIHNNVKIDDLVQIGQNQEIGENTVITTGFKAEAGVKIGSDTFIGMGVTIISGVIEIGNQCIIGAGTVVLKSVPDKKIVYCKYEQEIQNNTEVKMDQVFSNFKKIR